MSGAVCPSCGVAVVPGYVRCPKCHKPLPQRKGTAIEGGTALAATRRGPLLAVIAVAVISIALITFFGLRKGKKPAAAGPTPVEQEESAAPEAPAPTPDQPEQPAPPTGPNADDVAASLERGLKKQKLWSKVEIIGDHVDVRSSSCSEPAMAPLLENAAPSFKAAGLTRIRCLEQSGRVVTDRDL